jgi:hypothetical protein
MTSRNDIRTPNLHLPFTYEIARAEIDARVRRAERRRTLGAGRSRARSGPGRPSGGAA